MYLSKPGSFLKEVLVQGIWMRTERYSWCRASGELRRGAGCGARHHGQFRGRWKASARFPKEGCDLHRPWRWAGLWQMAEGQEQLGRAHIRARSPPWVALNGHAYIHSLQMQRPFLSQEALLAPLGSVQGTEKGRVFKPRPSTFKACPRKRSRLVPLELIFTLLRGVTWVALLS